MRKAETRDEASGDWESGTRRAKGADRPHQTSLSLVSASSVDLSDHTPFAVGVSSPSAVLPAAPRVTMMEILGLAATKADLLTSVAKGGPIDRHLGPGL